MGGDPGNKTPAADSQKRGRRCAHYTLLGDRCSNPTNTGGTYCSRHGGPAGEAHPRMVCPNCGRSVAYNPASGYVRPHVRRSNGPMCKGPRKVEIGGNVSYPEDPITSVRIEVTTRDGRVVSLDESAGNRDELRAAIARLGALIERQLTDSLGGTEPSEPAHPETD